MMHGGKSYQKGSPGDTGVKEVQHINKGGGQERMELRKIMHYLPEQILGWGGEGDQKKSWRHSREANTMKVRCRRTRRGGRLVLPAMAMVRLLEATMAEH